MYFSSKMYEQSMYFICMIDFAFCSPGTSVAVSSILLVLIMVGRAAFVFPLSFLINLTKKSTSEKISFRKQVCVLLL